MATHGLIRAYRETKELVESESKGYNDPSLQNEVKTMEAAVNTNISVPVMAAVQVQESEESQLNLRRAVFALSEGDVVLSFPENLSSDSVSDLEDYLKIFMKKAKREAGLDLV